ncbi:efflux RND transporter periplasmic adaptor subunit [Aminobacter sp. AP02]|uniref:efflux RND transporter periplasmic adaptor subunit n=1 Tax=Aminobacter sp. AP02 TaxID=2135737 RepID=UPI000D6CE87A|nr:efflux RND transporter periplasmic adaptor subunit [Aminobacter sp. AP02]PWK63716.1 RND family efflux transporter MFP subunit [Aminobacter sp. AP02]
MKSFTPFGMVVALALASCSQEQPAPKEVIRPVLSQVVQPQAHTALGFAGTIQPEFSADLAFRLLGRLVARDVSVGDQVTKGTTLAAIDPLSLELASQAARADLSTAEAQFANAAASEERQRALLAEANTSQAVYDSAKQALDSASANVERARAALAKTDEQLGYARLFSDFDGIVTATGAEVGQTVSPGQMVVTVARSDAREAVVDIPDQLVGRLNKGDEFEVSLQTLPSLRTTAHIREIAPQADAATRTRRVRLALDEPPTAFRLGSTVTASRVSRADETIDLPLSALHERDGKHFVWVVDPSASTVSLHGVDVRAKDGVSFTLNGIEPGTRVVTAGVNSLSEGQKVRIPEGA